MNTVATKTTLDVDDLSARIKQMYRDVALHPERRYHFETGRALAERLGYPAEELDAIPAGAVDSFAGVGYFLDLADLVSGECVLDLGSGSGMDSLLAARRVGSAGRVVGLDMTHEQLDKSRRLAAEARLEQVEFRRGYIEDPPVPDASIDVVISNGVLNLPPDKAAVFAQVAARAAARRPPGALRHRHRAGVARQRHVQRGPVGGVHRRCHAERRVPGRDRAGRVGDRSGTPQRLPVPVGPGRQRLDDLGCHEHLPACPPTRIARGRHRTDSHCVPRHDDHEPSPSRPLSGENISARFAPDVAILGEAGRRPP